ncbi:hypothetical protein NDU88_007378, partial [Pleurodeles waltl]
MTVHVYNPHVNIQDLTTFLRHHCTVTREPSRNLDSDGIWDSKWTVMVKLKEDPAAPDRIQHPPSSFSLGRDSGYLYYPGQTKLCNKCSKPGHTAKGASLRHGVAPTTSPATVEKEEASIEEEEQNLPANLEEEEPETSQVGKPASEKHQATVAKTTAPAPETHQEPDQP